MLQGFNELQRMQLLCYFRGEGAVESPDSLVIYILLKREEELPASAVQDDLSWFTTVWLHDREGERGGGEEKIRRKELERESLIFYGIR